MRLNGSVPYQSASFAAFWSQIDDPVRRADDVEVVLNDDDRVAVAGEAVEDVEEC